MNLYAPIMLAGEGGGLGGFAELMPIFVIAVVMIGMITFSNRSRKKKEQQVQQMRNCIEIGDEVVTTCGICGHVVAIKGDDEFVLETGDRNRIRFKKYAIATRNPAED